MNSDSENEHLSSQQDSQNQPVQTYTLQDFPEPEREILSLLCTKFPLDEGETKAVEQILTNYDIKNFTLFDYDGLHLVETKVNCLRLCLITQPTQTAPIPDLSQISLSEDHTTLIQGDLLDPTNFNKLYVMGAIATKNLCKFSFIDYMDINSPAMNPQDQMEVSDGVKFFVKHLSDALNSREDPLIALKIGREYDNQATHPDFIDLELKDAKISKLLIADVIVEALNAGQTNPRFSNFFEHLRQNKHLTNLKISYYHEELIDEYIANKKLLDFIENGRLSRLQLDLPSESDVNAVNVAAIIEAVNKSKTLTSFELSQFDDLNGDLGLVERAFQTLLETNRCLTYFKLDFRVNFDATLLDIYPHQLDYLDFDRQSFCGRFPECPSDTIKQNHSEHKRIDDLCKELQESEGEGFFEFCEQIKQLGYTLPRVHQLIRANEELSGAKSVIESHYRLLRKFSEDIADPELQEILTDQFRVDGVQLESKIDIDKVLIKILDGKFDFRSSLLDFSKKNLESILDKIFNYKDKNLSIQDPDSYKEEEDKINAQKYVKILLDAKIKEHPVYSAISESHRNFIDRFWPERVVSDGESAGGRDGKRRKIGDGGETPTSSPAPTISGSLTSTNTSYKSPLKQ